VTATHKIQEVRIKRSAYSGLRSTIVAWIVVTHLIGWVAGHYFEYQIGFYPVWFLDCTACLPRGGWLPARLPLVGGISYWVIIAAIASAVLAIGKRTGMAGRLYRAAAATGALSMLLFTVFALDTRYPGSLPSVVATVLPGAVATLAFSVAALVAGPVLVAAQDPFPMSPRSLAAVVLGPLSMVALGGLILIGALYASVTGYAKAPDVRNRRAAVGGLITGLLGSVLRWNLSGRYEFLGVWV